MNKLNYLFFVVSILAFTGVLYLFSASGNQNKTAYFLSGEVYNSFDYKIELEQELQQTQSDAQRVIDSLELDLNMTMDRLKRTEPSEEELVVFERKQQQYIEFRNQLEGGYGAKSQEFYNLIWDRINTYVQEYGKENNYTYIFGANGDGSIMYAQEENDITEEIIQMINKRYAGE